MVASEALTLEAHRKEFTGRLGVATVFISRFERISADEASEAVDSILSSLEQGNDVDIATAYLLEAMCVLYDVTGEVAQLEQAEAFIETPQQLRATTPGGTSPARRRCFDFTTRRPVRHARLSCLVLVDE